MYAKTRCGVGVAHGLAYIDLPVHAAELKHSPSTHRPRRALWQSASAMAHLHLLQQERLFSPNGVQLCLHVLQALPVAALGLSCPHIRVRSFAPHYAVRLVPVSLKTGSASTLRELRPSGGMKRMRQQYKSVINRFVFSLGEPWGTCVSGEVLAAVSNYV